MAEAAQDVSEVIIECMAFLMKKARGGGGGGGEHYQKKKISSDAVLQEVKNAL